MYDGVIGWGVWRVCVEEEWREFPVCRKEGGGAETSRQLIESCHFCVCLAQ